VRFDANALAVALGLTLFAGLATGIGSALAVFARRSSTRFLSISLGFSAGVMLYVSFAEILPKAERAFASEGDPASAGWSAAAAFFAGALVMGLIDWSVPKSLNPHEARSGEDRASLRRRGEAGDPPSSRLLRMGLFTAIAIAIHNFPEGIATFLAALEDPKLGTAIAIAVALHNIPEGVSVAVPVFYATGNRRRAFVLSFLSGLSEPLGAAAAWVFLLPWLTTGLMGALFGAVAGVMVYISLDELLPAAREYGRGHEVLWGVFSGMAAMAASLLMLR
jgi:ZIP family zinc transporter